AQQQQRRGEVREHHRDGRVLPTSDCPRREIEAKQADHKHPHNGLLVLRVRARSEPRASAHERAPPAGGQCGCGGSRHSFWTCVTSRFIATKASTRRGSKCRPPWVETYSKACSLAHAFLYGRTDVSASYPSAIATMRAQSGMWSPTRPFG